MKTYFVFVKSDRIEYIPYKTNEPVYCHFSHYVDATDPDHARELVNKFYQQGNAQHGVQSFSLTQTDKHVWQQPINAQIKP
jgi:hypothetical protein